MTAEDRQKLAETVRVEIVAFTEQGCDCDEDSVCLVHRTEAALAALAQPCQECEALRVKLAEAEREAAMWHREALDWQQAKSEADDSAEQAERQLEQARAALVPVEEQARWLLNHWTEPAFARPRMQEKALDLARAVITAAAREEETA